MHMKQLRERVTCATLRKKWIGDKTIKSELMTCPDQRQSFPQIATCTVCEQTKSKLFHTQPTSTAAAAAAAAAAARVASKITMPELL
jgi:hypothetical protein